MTRIAINGFGRIGRNILRAWSERRDCGDLEIVAINDLGEIEVNAHLLEYDSVHGRLGVPVSVPFGKGSIKIGDRTILCLSEDSVSNLPWAELNIDLVLECTGRFTDREMASAHLKAGAKKVLISAPGKNVDATVVYGVNHGILSEQHNVVSNASCTTNCLAPIAAVLQQTLGIEKGLATTVHAYTNDQVLSDVYQSDMMRARAATQSMIPTKTGAAAAVGLVLPELNGKLDGLAVRVPVINVSLLDLTVEVGRDTNVEEVNQILVKASEDMKGVLEINHLPLVSIDFNHHPASSIVDINQTKVIGNQVKVLAWYDNEWGFSNRMLDTAALLASIIERHNLKKAA